MKFVILAIANRCRYRIFIDPTLTQTAALSSATSEFDHAATYCANVHGRILCDAAIAAGTVNVIKAVADNSNAINSCG